MEKITVVVTWECEIGYLGGTGVKRITGTPEEITEQVLNLVRDGKAVKVQPVEGKK